MRPSRLSASILHPIGELDRAGLHVHRARVDPEVALRIRHEAAEDHVLRAEQLAHLHRGLSVDLARRTSASARR